MYWGIGGKPEWQSGEAADCAALFLTPKVLGPFLPLLAFVFLALAAFIMDIPRHCSSQWVRVGLVLGIVLGAQFTIMQWSQMEWFSIGVFVTGMVLLWGEWAIEGGWSWSAWTVGGAPDLTIVGSAAWTALFLLFWWWLSPGPGPALLEYLQRGLARLLGSF
jgi:hypothetical protein